jgi:hypothetical protein
MFAGGFVFQAGPQSGEKKSLPPTNQLRSTTRFSTQLFRPYCLPLPYDTPITNDLSFKKKKYFSFTISVEITILYKRISAEFTGWKKSCRHLLPPPNTFSFVVTGVYRTSCILILIFFFSMFSALADPDIGYQMSSTNAPEDCCYEHCAEHRLCVRNSTACDRGDGRADQRPLCVEEVPLTVEESECTDFGPTGSSAATRPPTVTPPLLVALLLLLLLLATCAGTAAAAPTAAVT